MHGESMIRTGFVAMVLGALVAAPGCGKKVEGEARTTSGTETESLPGVDLAAKKVYIGALNDESGPAASIGTPFANGKRLLARAVNAGDSGLLPAGWTVELVERDHAYNPQKAVQAYKEIKDQVLFIATSFGTPNTLPLRDQLERDGIIAFPASLSTQMGEHPHTPPVAASYRTEAMRAMDVAVEKAGGADAVKAAVVYQKDDYGADGLEGWKRAAAFHGVKLVAEQTAEPGQKDVTAIVTALKNAGATDVFLAVLPGTTAPILGTAAQHGYRPRFYGATPTWNDSFFTGVLPAETLERFYWVTGFPYWGEQRPGMDRFIELFEKHGQGMGEPDFYALSSYLAGLVQLEALQRTIASGDLSRASFERSMRSIDGFDAGGLSQPIDLSRVPYQVSVRTRVLHPEIEERTWTTVSDFAAPDSLEAAARR